MTEITFDATEVSVTNRGSYISVNCSTDFPDEVLNNFTPQDIMTYYSDKQKLFDILKEYYE